ncbi:hypothetical protein W97_02493 [Coniosporium apollinis CBS 100218]|uniref:Extensin domain-containing protein n=1 Tax=Coniosporium apollinis (strain CBS 100218) TaxID=1168221 RepID=R7YNN8_CONA1|nr:uncharacterized protein W97_02493 [Coniosporium apollinis CBS 100218]EON63266.1 hypothetical protein W97_02493 [Coniosporium apollinis CBS 100218]
MQDGRTLQNQPTTLDASLSAGDEILSDSDEPPDEREKTPHPPTLSVMPKFEKAMAPQFQRKESLLTQALQMSGTEEERRPSSGPSRGLSNASTWSNTSAASMAELTSDGGLASPCTRASSPSPPLPPANFGGLASTFKEPFSQDVAVRLDDQENIGPLQKPIAVADEKTVEANLGRRRCITFACGRKDQNKTESVGPPKAQDNSKIVEPLKRPTTIKFACTAKVSTDNTKAGSKSGLARATSPPPRTRTLQISPKPSSRSHRGSDSTVRNESPKSVRKAPPFARTRRLSINSDIGRTDATRFHEFASSEEEVEEWTQESTCHKSRLTVNDTLKLENGLRQLAEEVEEEALEDVEDEEELLIDDDDEDDDEDEELDEDLDDEEAIEEDSASVGASDDVSDAGFDTDDEEGFAESDDESDAGSDYNWWAPAGRSTAATSLDPPSAAHIRPTSGRRSISDSSIASVDSVDKSRKALGPSRIRRQRRCALTISSKSPELPDSTDFVCGTLDEDRPREEEYMSNLERRRAARHKITPQDIDPTFPASDPEMDEEDEVDEFEDIAEESENHIFMHGQPEEDGELRGRRARGYHTKHSPIHSPKRLRSPPPAKRTTTHRSPPPRRLFGQSPRRLRSPPPAARLKSPPGTCRTSTTTSPSQPPQLKLRFATLAERPQVTQSSSLPRTPTVISRDPLEDLEGDSKEGHSRRAIDIVKGLEKKRQLRKEKLYQKHCRKSGKDKERRPPPGKGAKRMREMGLELHAYNKGRSKGPWEPQKVHMLSY